MTEEDFYLDEGNVKITAASVGISKERWEKITVSEIQNNNDKHKSLMKDNRYDVIPIIDNDGTIKEFFKVDEPNNYNNISRLKISNTDKIPLDTGIREIIEKFNNENRNYYFLTYESRITGLITIGNLNCRQVQVYIFNKVCDLERTLSEFINDNIQNNEIITYIKEQAKAKDKYKIVLYNYQELINSGYDNNITEQLYLVDFFEIIKKFSLNMILEISNTQWDSFKGINVLRNIIAHPTKSLLDSENNIEKLISRLIKIESLTSKLKKLKIVMNKK